MTSPAPRFRGSDLTRDDTPRLESGLDRVKRAALSWPGGWFAVDALAASPSVQLRPASAERYVRYMREPRFGGFDVEKKHVGNGLWRYRVLEPEPDQGELF